jgi:phosphoribosylamine--glycine ligase
MPAVLVIGSGGREHAIVAALAGGPSRPRVCAAPGNPGMEALADLVPISANDRSAIVRLAREREVDLVVVGPEAPLVDGLADALRSERIPVLGPSRDAARLEGSKAFAKSVMADAGVPTARWGAFTDAGEAIRFARGLEHGAVVKADGLAAGKGVTVASTIEEAERAIGDALGGRFGAAGERVVIEERLLGEELSVIALVDGARIQTLAPAQDHKRLLDGDRGPNTGGMGAYSPAPLGTADLVGRVDATCLRPVVDLLASRGTPFSGVLYAGIMLTAEGPRVLEYNVRLGDPETQAILPRLGEDAFELFLSAAEGRLPDRPVRFEPVAAATVVVAAEGYPGTARSGDPIEGLDRAGAIDRVTVFHAGTRRDGGRTVTAGGRVVAVTGLGATLAEAVDRAYRGVDEVRFPGMQFRRDIASRALR